MFEQSCCFPGNLAEGKELAPAPAAPVVAAVETKKDDRLAGGADAKVVVKIRNHDCTLMFTLAMSICFRRKGGVDFLESGCLGRV